MIPALSIAAFSAYAQGYRPAADDAPAQTIATVLPPSVAPLTEDERTALRLSVSQCWNTGELDKDTLAVSVTVGVTLNPDGTPDPESVAFLSFEGGAEPAAQQAYQAARRAIIRCGAQGFALPPASYDAWRTVEMTFNPARMRIK